LETRINIYDYTAIVKKPVMNQVTDGEPRPSDIRYCGHICFIAVLAPLSFDLGRASSARGRGWTYDSATEFTSSSFIQMYYDLFNGQRHASCAPLTVSDDGIAPLSNDIAVPVDPLDSSRRPLFPNRLELERFTLPDIQ